MLESHKALNARLAGIQGMLAQMRRHLALQIEGQQAMLSEKAALEDKVLGFQECLIREVEKFEELHFRQNEEIIRLETLNKILHIEIGECRERESVMFSIVKEASLIKEREREGGSRTNSHTNGRTNGHNNSQRAERDTPATAVRSMKESSIGEINLLSKKSRTTRIEEEDADETTEDHKGLRSDALLKSKNRIYFDSLVSKNG